MKPILHAPGIYFGMTADEYHADPSLGSTGIRALIKSPRKYWLRSLRNPGHLRYEEADKDSTKVGTAVHVALLDGASAFASQYVRRPDDQPDATPAQKSAITRAANVAADAAGKILLHGDDWGLIEDLSWLIPSHPELADVLIGGEHEVSVFWEDGNTAVPCKCRFDILKPRGIGDLKTIENQFDMRLETACKLHIKRFRYDIQAEHYMEGRGQFPLLLKAGQVFFCGVVPPDATDIARGKIDFIRECIRAKEFHFQLVFASKSMPEVWGCYLSRKNPILRRAREHIDGALLALETEGKLLRGRFTPASAMDALEWCDRRLLARIHRYTLNRLRAEIEPVSAADFMRFLLHWQHAAGETQVKGVEGLAAVIEQLDGYEVPAGAWEQEVLAARVQDYEPDFIDRLCVSGRVAWGRLSPANGSGKAPLRSSPIALMLREHAGLWRANAESEAGELSSEASAVYEVLRSRGASFFHELVSATGQLHTQVERSLGELASSGLVTADSFGGLRALLAPSDKHKRRSHRRRPGYEVDTAGRWARLRSDEAIDDNRRTESIARALLDRYGVVFRALLARESRLPTWRELAGVYRRLEARGEIRGGRFVSGFGGEQFALPDAVGRLRAVRKLEKNAEFVALSGADPLNLVGIVTPDARVAAIAPNRVLFRDGLAIAALESGRVRRLAASDLDDDALKTFFWRRSSTLGFTPRRLSEASRKRLLEHKVRVPLPG